MHTHFQHAFFLGGSACASHEHFQHADFAPFCTSACLDCACPNCEHLLQWSRLHVRMSGLRMSELRTRPAVQPFARPHAWITHVRIANTSRSAAFCSSACLNCGRLHSGMRTPRKRSQRSRLHFRMSELRKKPDARPTPPLRKPKLNTFSLDFC